MSRIISFAKTPSQFLDGSKDTTRRSGPNGPTWVFARPGDVCRATEWLPRWRWCYRGAWIGGGRWVCESCGFKGVTDPEAGWSDCPECEDASWIYRGPRDLGEIIILEVGEARLGDISATEVRREGFPNMSPFAFPEFYGGPAKKVLLRDHAAGIGEPRLIHPAEDWIVTRLAFARIIDGIVRRQAITVELGEWAEIEGLAVAEAQELIRERSAS